jgi:hypothetical protein
MRSFENRFYRTDKSVWTRIKRNFLLALWIAKLILTWFIQGRRLRKASRRALREGYVLYLDDLINSEHDD